MPLKVTEELACSLSFLIFREALSFTKEFDSEHIIAMHKYNELEFHFRNWILSQSNILKIVPVHRFRWNATKFSLGLLEHLLLAQPLVQKRYPSARQCLGLEGAGGGEDE